MAHAKAESRRLQIAANYIETNIRQSGGKVT
jgi:hypothetical protein